MKTWHQEVRHYCRHAAIILVGNKTDLRNDPETVESLERTEETTITEKQAKLVLDQVCTRMYHMFG